MTADDHVTAGAQWPNTPSGSGDDQPHSSADVNDWLRRKGARRQRRDDAHQRALGIPTDLTPADPPADDMNALIRAAATTRPRPSNPDLAAIDDGARNRAADLQARLTGTNPQE